MEEYRVLLVQPKDISRIWVGVKPLIDTALGTIQNNDTREYLISEDFKGWLEAALAQLFIVVKDNEIKLITITELNTYPRDMLLQYLMISGKELKHCYKKLAAEVEAFARREKCTRMTVTARKGMMKYLPEWEEVKDKHSINLIKDL
tara:strand:+ start:116 stop:556 length:441 start_codon:yes stop_codon:yes gene_type:complete